MDSAIQRVVDETLVQVIVQWSGEGLQPSDADPTAGQHCVTAARLAAASRFHDAHPRQYWFKHLC